MLSRVLLLAAAVLVGVWLFVLHSDERSLSHATAIVDSAHPSPARVSEGFRLIDRAGRLNPADVDRLIVRSSLFGFTGNAAGVESAAKKAVAEEPQNVRAWVFLANVTARIDPRTSAGAVRRVAELDPVRPPAPRR